MSTESGKKSSWWATLPGILTALATTATAMAALIAALHNAGVIGQSEPSVASANVVAPAAQASAVEPAKPESFKPVEVSQPATLPVKVEPEIITERVPVERHHSVSNEQSAKELEYIMDFYTTSHFRMNFSFGAKACSKIRLFIFVDDEQRKETPFFDESTGWQNLGPLPAGKHTLRLLPEGRVGGCNTGRLISWGGTLTLETTKL